MDAARILVSAAATLDISGPMGHVFARPYIMYR